MKINNKNIIITILVLLIIIEATIIFFSMKTIFVDKEKIEYSSNNEKLNTNMFAIMLEKSDGVYEQSDSNSIPGETYTYNEVQSGCVDSYGNKISGILSYDINTKKVKLETDSAVFCYLYFDMVKGDFLINIKTNGIENISPSTSGYEKEITCNNDTEPLWNNKYNRLEIENINGGREICNISYNTKTNTYTSLISKIQGTKTKTDTNGGICSQSSYTTKSTCESANAIWWGVFEENGLRYEGLNPDNYVWFNNEMWRIIGYVPTKDASGNDTNLVKIIKDSAIGVISYDDDSNVYTDSRMYNLLNKYYYVKKDGTNSSYCYAYKNIAKSCNYSGIGLNIYARAMVEPVQWPIGIGKTNVTNSYSSEIGTYTSISGGINVGMMTMSDYGAGVLSSDCERSESFAHYASELCSGKNWMYRYNMEWTMTPTGAGKLMYIYLEGSYNTVAAVNIGLQVRPVVHLDSSVYVTDGDGSSEDPYIIAMD